MKNMSQNTVIGGCNGNPLRNGVEPAARKILRTNQPTILARAGHVQQAAVCQSSPVAPFRWGNRLAFRGRGQCCFLRCKDLLPDKYDLSRVFCDFGGKMLCNHLRKAVVIFCQALPLTMKNMGQNMAGGGRAAKENSRQYEIRGQRRQRGRFSSNHFFPCNDLLPEKCDLSRVLPKLAGRILCKPCAKPPEFSARLVN
jgi:hypothetical protein